MNKLIFDTSIWIEYFKVNPIYFSPCQKLLDDRSVFILEIIFAELIQGAKSKREIELISGYYENLPKLDQDGLIFEAGLFSQKEKLISRGIGLIDAIIISAAQKNRLKVWTLDKKIIRFLGADQIYAAD